MVSLLDQAPWETVLADLELVIWEGTAATDDISALACNNNGANPAPMVEDPPPVIVAANRNATANDMSDLDSNNKLIDLNTFGPFDFPIDNALDSNFDLSGDNGADFAFDSTLVSKGDFTSDEALVAADTGGNVASLDFNTIEGLDIDIDGVESELF